VWFGFVTSTQLQVESRKIYFSQNELEFVFHDSELQLGKGAVSNKQKV
jgi:hypothetical protein